MTTSNLISKPDLKIPYHNWKILLFGTSAAITDGEEWFEAHLKDEKKSVEFCKRKIERLKNTESAQIPQ